MLDNLNVKYFPFFDSVKSPVSAAGVSSPCFNNGYDTMILEVSGATTISATVEGCVNQLNQAGMQDDASCAYTSLAIFKASDLTKVTSIANNGIYYIGINGCSRVRINIASITGSAKVVGALEK